MAKAGEAALSSDSTDGYRPFPRSSSIWNKSGDDGRAGHCQAWLSKRSLHLNNAEAMAEAMPLSKKKKKSIRKST